MTTRIYLPSTGTPPLEAMATEVQWEYTNSLVRLPCYKVKQNTALTTLTRQPPTASGTYQWAWIQYQSECLLEEYDWTTADTISMVIGKCAETTTGGDAQLAYSAQVVSKDGSYIRGTIGWFGSTSTEFPLVAAAATRIFNASNAGATNFRSYKGDRIIIEIGLHLVTPAIENMQMRAGDPSAVADFALTSGLTTDLCPWVELSKTVSLGEYTPAVRSVDFLGFDTITDTGLTTAIKRYTFNLTLKYTTQDGVQHTYGPVQQIYPNDLANMSLSAQKAFAIRMIDAAVRVSLGLNTWEDFS